MPKKQLIILAVISLAEQTALNSISPYLPEMAASFPEVNPQQIGLFVGLIASSFAAAQFTSMKPHHFPSLTLIHLNSKRVLGENERSSRREYIT